MNARVTPLWGVFFISRLVREFPSLAFLMLSEDDKYPPHLSSTDNKIREIFQVAQFFKS